MNSSTFIHGLRAPLSFCFSHCFCQRKSCVLIESCPSFNDKKQAGQTPWFPVFSVLLTSNTVKRHPTSSRYPRYRQSPANQLLIAARPGNVTAIIFLSPQAFFACRWSNHCQRQIDSIHVLAGAHCVSHLFQSSSRHLEFHDLLATGLPPNAASSVSAHVRARSEQLFFVSSLSASHVVIPWRASGTRSYQPSLALLSRRAVLSFGVGGSL